MFYQSFYSFYFVVNFCHKFQYKKYYTKVKIFLITVFSFVYSSFIIFLVILRS